jgi:hypothetical protein
MYPIGMNKTIGEKPVPFFVVMYGKGVEFHFIEQRDLAECEYRNYCGYGDDKKCHIE